MRNISFMLTKDQFINQTKTVTRRLGWKFLKAGDRLMGCEKCQGLKKGETLNRLGAIEVVKVSEEQLSDITKNDVIKEGFPEMTSLEFITFFCEEMRCKPDEVVTRIEFRYLNGLQST